MQSGRMTSGRSNLDSYRGPVGPLLRRCSQCLKTDVKLLRCSACRVTFYCSQDHQVAHRPKHKSICTEIRKDRVTLTIEDDDVRNATPDAMTPANAFETDVGNFWDLAHTRDYMCARYALVLGLLSANTLDAVQEALEHMRDMLRLCRSDNIGIRMFTPAVMLRLDLDQECYDFVKWWAICDEDGEYDWGDPTLPYLDIHGADINEDPDFLDTEPADVHNLVAILILKLKLLVDIRNVKLTRQALAPRPLPAEVLAAIELEVVRSPLSAKLSRESTKSLIHREMRLERHLRQLGAILFLEHRHFICNLFEPDEALATEVTAWEEGSWDEMALAIQCSYPAWWETEGVLDLLKEARTCAKSDSENQIEAIFGYLDVANQNASYLGPWSNRPSERCRKREPKK